jgi:hypothetical protein
MDRFSVTVMDREVAAMAELLPDLPMQHPLVRLDRHQDIGPLGEAPVKNAFVVCRASDWMSTPSRRLLRIDPRPASPQTPADLPRVQ